MTPLAQKIKILRVSRGLSQEDFAKKMGVARGTISYWETGRQHPSTSRIYKMCERFNVKWEFFNPAKTQVVLS